MVNGFVPRILILLQLDSQTLLLARLERLGSTVEVLRDLLLILESLLTLFFRYRGIYFVGPQAIPKGDLLIDSQTV